MNQKLSFSIIVIAIIFGVLIFSLHPIFLDSSSTEKQENPEIFVGVTFCGNTTDQAKLLVDRVKNYTNLFVLYSGPVSKNETAMTEISEYAIDGGLSIAVYFGDLNSRILPLKNLEWRVTWIKMAKQRWGDKFLGVHYYDEPGGIYIDHNWNETLVPYNVTFNDLTYDSVADLFIRGFQRDDGFDVIEKNSVDAFVSDYALYWFDYLAGYDVVLTQVGWNHSLTQDIALLRGAAKMQNKSWGEMITWKYNNPPYLDSGENIYEQMRIGYECGAEYFMIFNYPSFDENKYGTLLDEHFEALEKFWNEVVNNNEVVHGSIKAETALVLPKNYGWGMRRPNDRIWGWWGPDENSEQIWNISQNLIDQYGLTLDIVYDDQTFPFNGIYPQIYFWNNTKTFSNP